MKIISIGEILWDVIGDTEHLGGAPFNFAAHAARLGHAVDFISAVGDDPRGQRAVERMAELGLSARYVRRRRDQPTGVVTVRLEDSGQPHFVIHRPAAYDFPELTDTEFEELARPSPDCIYFGTLVQMSPPAHRLTRRVLESHPRARRFYDVNLRTGCYEENLVRKLLACATVVKVNEVEAAAISRMHGRELATLEDFCRTFAAKFGWEAVCVTRAAQGCVLLVGSEFAEASGYAVEVADAVGAGDAFAAAFVHALSQGWPPAEVADFANRVGALVASRAGAIPPWTIEEARALTARTAR